MTAAATLDNATRPNMFVLHDCNGSRRLCGSGGGRGHRKALWPLSRSYERCSAAVSHAAANFFATTDLAGLACGDEPAEDDGMRRVVPSLCVCWFAWCLSNPLNTAPLAFVMTPQEVSA